MVILAVVLPTLLGAMALCADVAVFYFNWANLQKAADSAALAGAHYLPNDTARPPASRPRMRFLTPWRPAKSRR